eukprot:gnl/Dysnectes_brevis/228_a259_6416.p1 GENE.gnl/Dysnectes_brevis/228_a259_6416~~gnl/Dysnectes_brevis/228_a259_6416.p1  ORF type:complete len:555 (+),score=202.33 gnl/Dysnectes_brevis/228_a259_6416:97-1761(+)
MQMLFSVILLLSIFIQCVVSEPVTASVVYQHGGMIVVDGLAEDYIAYGEFDDLINSTGWANVYVKTNSNFSDYEQAYAAGIVEGYISAPLSAQHWLNFLNVFEDTYGMAPFPHKLLNFLDDQFEYAEDNAKRMKDSDDYWLQIGLMCQQARGFVDGYMDGAPEGSSEITLSHYLAFQAQGDLYEIMPALYSDLRATPNELSTAERHHFWTSCSALVTLTPAMDDLILAHATWTDYRNMLRVYKTYEFDYSNSVALNVTFSSKPMYLFSKDDFWVMSSGLVVMETTNSIMGDALYDLINSDTLLIWQRTAAASRLAATPQEWVEYFKREHSGTYTNQWMVANTNSLTPYEPLPAGSFWVVEEIPGYTHDEDMTDVLNTRGWWPSYNLPYFDDIYTMSGYQEAYEQYGDEYSYTNCSRAEIFDRDAPSIQNVDDMKTLIRSNHYQIDPLSAGDPSNAISSRYDLPMLAVPPPAWSIGLTNGDVSAFGGIDAKVTSFSMLQDCPQCAHAQCGPTHDDQVPFTWSTFPGEEDLSHVGHPDTFEFDWVLMTNGKSQPLA